MRAGLLGASGSGLGSGSGRSLLRAGNCSRGSSIARSREGDTRVATRYGRRPTAERSAARRASGSVGGRLPSASMIDLDERVILPDAPQYNASLVAAIGRDRVPRLLLVRFDGEATPFEPGQYMTIGVFAEDAASPTASRIVQRPYSVASDPGVAGADGYELYVRLVEGGLFTPLLWRLPLGHRMRMIGPKGKFVLEPDDDRTHLFISSGTGNAPFVSMMKALLRRGRAAQGRVPQRRLVRAATSATASSRGLAGWRAARYPVTFVPTVSRPARARERRLGRPVGPGRVDRRAGLRRARAHARQHDRLHLRQPGHDPGRRGDAARARLPRGRRSRRSSTGRRARNRPAQAHPRRNSRRRPAACPNRRTELARVVVKGLSRRSDRCERAGRRTQFESCQFCLAGPLIAPSEEYPATRCGRGCRGASR